MVTAAIEFSRSAVEQLGLTRSRSWQLTVTLTVKLLTIVNFVNFGKKVFLGKVFVS